MTTNSNADRAVLAPAPRSIEDTARGLKDGTLIMVPGAGVTSAVAARYLGIGESTLRSRRREGTGPDFYRIGRRVFYQLADLDRWIETQKQGSK